MPYPLGHGANGLVDIGFLTKPYCTSKIIHAGRAGGRAAGEPIVPSDRPTNIFPTENLGRGKTKTAANKRKPSGRALEGEARFLISPFARQFGRVV